MAEIPVSSVVNVTITTTPLAPSRAGFGTLLFLTTETGVPFYEGVRVYSTLAAVADDWSASTEVYKAALVYFAQVPSPTSFAVGTRFSTAQAGLLLGGGNAEDMVATWNLISDGAFIIAIDGDSVLVDGIDFSADVTMADIADAIETALQAESGSGFTGATCVWDGAKFVITSGTTGAASSVSVTSIPGSGTDISVLMDNDLGNGTPYAGIDAETDIGDALDRLNAANSDWYALALIKTIRDDSDVEDAAAWIEANVKQFFTASNDITTLDSATATDLASVLNALSYRRTFVIYSSQPDQYPEISCFGKMATVNFDADDSVSTLKFKTLPGITVEGISAGQLTTLTGKGCNVYVEIGGVNILTEGIMVAGVGIFQDTVHGVDWLQNAIETDVYAFLVTQPTRVALTDEGASSVEAQVARALAGAVRNGLVAPGYNLAGTKYYQAGYETAVGNVSDMSIADRQQRKCPPITFVAIGAGAIHSAIINGTFEA